LFRDWRRLRDLPATRFSDDLLFTTDMLIENVHFRRETHKPAEAGRKALARGLSDIAAMGGAPRFCLVSLCVGASLNEKWVDGFFAGLLALASESGTVLAAGIWRAASTQPAMWWFAEPCRAAKRCCGAERGRP